jgi:hypothetical protein
VRFASQPEMKTDIFIPAVINFLFYHFLCSQCSVTCGTGISMRTFTCRSLDGKPVPDSTCSAVENKPAFSQECTKQSCEHGIQVRVLLIPLILNIISLTPVSDIVTSCASEFCGSLQALLIDCTLHSLTCPQI